ncbi:hypothetical protein KBD34_00625 [Patescibacteria group bacterium]|nr:hypothetical protein [Patescibacteria group bacterium]
MSNLDGLGAVSFGGDASQDEQKKVLSSQVVQQFTKLPRGRHPRVERHPVDCVRGLKRRDGAHAGRRKGAG